MDIAINSFLDDVPNMDNQWNWWKHRYLLILKGLEFGTTRHLRCKYLMVTHGILAHQYTPQVRGGLSGTHMTCHLLTTSLLIAPISYRRRLLSVQVVARLFFTVYIPHPGAP